jgi:hypothetical protein
VAIPNRNRRAGPIHEHLFPGFVLLPQNPVELRLVFWVFVMPHGVAALFQALLWPALAIREGLGRTDLLDPIPLHADGSFAGPSENCGLEVSSIDPGDKGPHRSALSPRKSMEGNPFTSPTGCATWRLGVTLPVKW